MATDGVSQEATGNQDIDGLLSGSRRDSTSITYNFPVSAGYYPANYNGANNEPASFVAVSPSFRSMVRDALYQYELVANVTFTEVGAGDAANISVGRTGNLNGYNPGSAGRAGDVWFLSSTAQVADSEVRVTWRLVMHELGWLQARHDWPGLNAVIRVESERWTIARTERETRSYITSLTTRAEHCGPMVRDHWAIENALHWVMDMTFRDDECRVRTDQAPANFATRRHIAHNLVRRPPGKKWDCPSKSMVRSAGAGFSDHLSGNGFFQSLPHHFEGVPAPSPALCGKAG